MNVLLNYAYDTDSLLSQVGLHKVQQIIGSGEFRGGVTERSIVSREGAVHHDNTQ